MAHTDGANFDDQRYDLLAFSLILLSCILAAWTGIGGAFLSEAQANGCYKELKDWQTLMGVVGASIIAWIAVLPVWRQVVETQRQAAGAAIIPLMKTVETLEAERKVVFQALQAMSRLPYLFDEYDTGNYHEIFQTQE